MIKIEIAIDGDKVYDSFEHEDTTLGENAMAVRRLEEIKKALLEEFDYDDDFYVEE